MSRVSCTGDCCTKATEWKNKYENSEEKLLQLKKLSHQGITEYETLQRKYDQNQKQYEELKAALEETQSKLTQVEEVLEPVSMEFQQMAEKVEVMEVCRTESERYASKVSKQNMKLKRQSQMLLSHLNMAAVELDMETMGKLTDEGEEDEETVESDSKSSNTDRDALNKLITELQSETAELTEQAVVLQDAVNQAQEKEKAALKQLAESTQQNTILEEDIETLKGNIAEKDLALKNLQQVSMRVYEEAADTQAMYAQQVQLQTLAEEHAHKMLKERDVMARQSSALIASATSDKRLMETLAVVERLTQEKGDIKRGLELKVAELEKNLEQYQDYEAEKTQTDEQLLAATNEIERLTQQYNKATKYQARLETEIKELSEKLNVAEERLRPPPPPPPPPIPTIMKPLRLLMGHKKPAGAKKNPGEEQNPTYQKAVDEMMKRIKQGTALKQVKRPMSRKASLPSEENPAINELQKMLGNLKRSKSASQIHDSDKPTPSKEETSKGSPSPKPTPAPRNAQKETKKALSFIDEGDEK